MPATLPLPERPAPTLSTEVKNILDAPPTWLVRWGSMLLLGTILMVLGAAGFVRYPQAIVGPVTVYAGRQPVAATATLAAALGRRVQVGQRVLISLTAFPSEKYGRLTGHVVHVTQPAGTRQATVAIALDEGYRSTHGQLLPVAATSQGTAQLIVADKRLLERILRW